MHFLPPLSPFIQLLSGAKWNALRTPGVAAAALRDPGDASLSDGSAPEPHRRPQKVKSQRSLE